MEKFGIGQGVCARKTLVYSVATVFSSMTWTCRAGHAVVLRSPRPCRYPWNRYLCGIESSGCLGYLYRRETSPPIISACRMPAKNGCVPTGSP